MELSPHYPKFHPARNARQGPGPAWERLRRTYTDCKQAYPGGLLCQRCASIDWSHLVFDDAVHYCREDRLRLFTVPEANWQLAASSCPLCQLLGHRWSFEENPDRSLTVRCIVSDDARYRDPPRHTPLLDLVIFDKYFYPQETSQRILFGIQQPSNIRSSFLLPKLDLDKLDYANFRNWLDQCERHHGSYCDWTYSPPIPGLKVIDCDTMQVVPAPEHDPRYVALSYVWGNTEASSKDQSGFPPTIRDAITVTTELGYRYLWVDQYCIDQLDAKERTAQIQLMDRIYAESQLVIIAAAGDSSSYGLPGVGERPRKAQRRLNVGPDVEIIEMPNVKLALTSSTWATRAWTYQEGYLARRRLVFTDDQVLYVCGRVSWEESEQQPFLEIDKCNRGVHYPIFGRFWAPKFRVFDVLTNYTTRTMSFDSDILNACTGILTKIAGFHLWGMVATQRVPNGGHLLLSMRWYNKCVGQRREGFPSWSWAGTSGSKLIKHIENSHDTGYVVHTRATDGRWVSLEELTECRYDPLPIHYGPTLRLTGMFYTVSLVGIRTSSGVKVKGRKPRAHPLVLFKHAGEQCEDIEIAFEVLLDTELTESDFARTVKAVLFESTMRLDGDWDCDRPPEFWILQAVGDNYERIGITGPCCWTLEKKTGIMRKDTCGVVSPHSDCRGDEEVLYVE